MQNKIAIILPVRDFGLDRSKRLIRCLNSYLEMTEGLSDVHILHDTDECHIYHDIVSKYPGTFNYCVPADITLMQKLNFNSLDIAKQYKYIGFIGDDIVFKTKFETVFIEYLSSVKHGMVFGSDLYQNRPTHPFMTSKTILAVGFYGLPAVDHNYFDDYWGYIFRELQTVKYCPDIIMEHLHPAAGKEQFDEISNSIYNNLRIEEKRFGAYMAENLYSDLDKIIKYEDEYAKD